jgi:hypothetical protein
MATNNVLVDNLCSWPLYFHRATGQGDVMIPANAKNYPLLSRDEVQAQIQLGNKMFTGEDGLGNHARIRIVDDAARSDVFGVEGVQTEAPVILDEDAVKALLAIKSKAKFNERLRELVSTDAEKRMLVDLAFKCGAEDAETWKVDALRALADQRDF